MEPNSVEAAIEKLERTLNQGYLNAERLLSLRTTDTNELNKALKRVDELYTEFISALMDAKLDNGVAAAAAFKNKQNLIHAYMSGV